MLKPNYRSRQLAALHGAATALHDVGALDKKTMRDIDALCLTKVEPLSTEEILELRDPAGGNIPPAKPGAGVE